MEDKNSVHVRVIFHMNKLAIIPEQEDPGADVIYSRTVSCVLLLLGPNRTDTTFVKQALNKVYLVSHRNESQFFISACHKSSKQNISSIDDQCGFFSSVFADWSPYRAMKNGLK